jgi:predicted RNase H-like HicB family nuclease
VTVITVVFHSEPEGCWADSPDIPGFSAAADDLPSLRAQVDAAVRELLGALPQFDERYDPPVRGTTQLSIFRSDWLGLSGWNSESASGTLIEGSPKTHQDPTHPIPTPRVEIRA